ncbi:AMP-binding protein [Jejuia spongiicola]|uniref:AMP-binding protein n=1 Tax=Jejuia spongiicola TaxID=2942207 RepID=A0ABT0QDH1_9FLAO|nr:AMP-binding protein [Jejuia spongiicola]MCL6294980.1 AMP-binding protein [Jejuia spongiicola]
MEVIDKISSNLKKYGDNTSFHINNTNYSYKEFSQVISNIRYSLASIEQSNIGLITYDDIETYASIFALWFEGKSYIPISPTAPKERNKFILNEVKSKTILSSKKLYEYESDFHLITTSGLANQKINIQPKQYSKENLAYILFTSGSTGTPKGVPISFKNLNSLVKNINLDANHNIFPTDKCLQMFDLTFDFSVVTYLMPLLNGASVYTIPKNQIKYLYIYKLIIKQRLTYLIMVPSIIHYLKPFFKEIDAKYVRYCCFGAAPLYIDVFEQWKKCIPEAKLYNSYGPTEFTVTTSYYSFQDNAINRTRNGVVSLGKPMKNIIAIVIDDDFNILPPNTEGELCLAGLQLTSGYLNNDSKNKSSFFEINHLNEKNRFYRTGDLCSIDDDGYLIFIGRKDFQVKIGGYRVELAEVEFHAKLKEKRATNITAIDITNNLGNTELALAIESHSFDTQPMLNYMKTKMPDYMIPMKIKFIKEFPHNANGKIDRKKLKQYFENI